jgi:error-prone DNA polymerase
MRYAELHARTHFSFLDGSSRPEELVRKALRLQLPALAITDVAGVYGIVEARDALLESCGLGRGKEQDAPLKLIYGSEIPFDDDRAVVLARTRLGYANLCEIITVGRRAAEKGEYLLREETLLARSADLILLAGGPGSAALQLLCGGNAQEAGRRLSRLREAFGDRCHVELVRHGAPGDRERSRAMAQLAKRLGIPVVATNAVHFHSPVRKRLHDLLRCIQAGCSLAEAGRRLLPNSEAHLKSAERMSRLFADLPEAIERTTTIADTITFRLCDVLYEPPDPELPEGETADTVLARESLAGLRDRLGERAGRHESKLRMELALIAELGYAGYFLVMWDVVITCRKRGILCQGRGSAANSIVCFALGITSVDPDVIGMLFERFLSRERNEPPDIDLDIEHERREEIIQYVYDKYSRERAGMVAEVIRYRHRSAVQDLGKVFGLPPEKLARLSKFMSHGWAQEDSRAFDASGIALDNPVLEQLLIRARQIEDFPRHLSIHVGGFVLSKEPLLHSVPIENGRMVDRTVIQWNKDDVDSMGMFKLDLLGLGMLTVLAKCFALVRTHRGRDLTLQTVPSDDQPTYQMLQQADSVGVFQVESRAQMSMLPRLKPKTFYDLVIEVAIVRPGPIQGGMVHPYLRRKEGREEPDYPDERLKQVLHRTLGVPLFQEQVMQLATVIGGYSPGEADQLRRDMAAWRRNGKMERHRERLISHMLENGISQEYAERIYRQLEGFGSYGFPESHAAAFAHLAYVSAYLKCHFPAEFAAALINSQPMGFYSPAVIVNDAKRHDVRILPIDVHRSDWDCTIEEGAIRLGLRLVRGLGEASGQALVLARRSGSFASVEELSHRAGLRERQLVALAAAGALRSLHRQRRQALWHAMSRSPGPLFDGLATEEPPASLPALATLEKLRLDISYGSAFPETHPMQHLRATLDREGILPAAALKQVRVREEISVAGLVITRQRPGEGRIIYVTLEDETGHADCALTEKVFAEFEDVVRLSPALIITGSVNTSGDARNIFVTSVMPLSTADVPEVPSHDFH